MKRATRQQWVDALRSGLYKQGKGRLCEQDRYCCLGVLASIEGLLDSEGTVGGNATLLPPEILPLYRQKLLAEMNDGGASFSALASEIESFVICTD